MSDLQVHPKAHPLDISKHGPFVILGDGSLMTFASGDCCVSRDDGKTWDCRRAIVDSGPEPRWESALLRTAEGTVILVYMDNSTRRWAWDNETHEPLPDSKIEVWSIRSADEGKTWSAPVQLFDGYCGAIVDIIQTRSGRVIVPVQRLLYDPGRHAQATYSSDDEGATWRRSNILDFGGHGHHDGVCEGSLAELRDGRIWMLLRTNMERFWQAFSDDGGLYWRTLLPTDIDSASAPPYVTRLASGRLTLAWNRAFREGLSDEEKANVEPRGGDCNWSEHPVRTQRNELSIAFSEDDGQTWTAPQVLLKSDALSMAYPFILERRPGEVWVTTRFKDRVGAWLREEDFV